MFTPFTVTLLRPVVYLKAPSYSGTHNHNRDEAPQTRQTADGRGSLGGNHLM